MSLWYQPRPAPSLPRPAVPAPLEPTPHPFRGWTESLFVTGVVRGPDRLSDVFNLRQPLTVEDAAVLPHGTNNSALVFPRDAVFDPFDFDLILGGELDARSRAGRTARRIYKVQYQVVVEGGDFEVQGVIHLFPGNAPEFAMHHTNMLFMPVTRPVVRRQRRLVSDPNTDVVLVNRFAISKIRQLDTLS